MNSLSLNKINFREVVFQGIFILLILWGIVYYLRLFDQKLLVGDEGVALNHAIRIMNGEIPHRDFFIFVPPLSFILNALFLKVLGESIFTSRFISLILAILIILIQDRVLKKMAVDFSLRVMSFSLLIPFGVSYWPIPSHHWWAGLFCLISAYFLLLSNPIANSVSQSFLEEGDPSSLKERKGFKSKRLFLFLSGCFSSLAIWTLQDQGGYFFILISLFFIFSLFNKKLSIKDKKKIFKNFLIFILGLIFASLPLLIYLLPSAGLKSMYQDLVEFPLFSYHNLEGHKFNPFSGWSNIYSFFKGVRIFDFPFYAISFLSISILLFILPLLNFVSLLKGKLTRNVNFLELYLTFSIFLTFFLTALHRWSFTNIVWSLPGLIIPLKYLFEGKTKKIARGLSIFFSICAVVFSISFYNFSNSERLFSICGKSGCIRVFPSLEAKAIKEAIAYLETYGKEGETLFCSGFCGMVNFITKMKNPTPFNDFVDYNTDEHFQILKKSIIDKKVDFILVTFPKRVSKTKVEEFIKPYYNKVFENKFGTIYKIKSK